MLDILSTFGIDVRVVLSGLLVSAVVLFTLYRRFFFSLFEPLSTFFVAQVGDATIMWALPAALTYKLQFGCYMLSLWLGFALRSKRISTTGQIIPHRLSLFELRVTLAVLCVLLVGANLYLGATVGFPLLSADPTEAKFTVYSGGLGLVRRLDMGPYYLFCCGCVLLIVLNESRRLALGMLGVATSLVMLGGGKSVILPLLFSLSFAVAHPGLTPSDALRKKAKKYLVLILGAGLSIALLITSKEQGGLLGGVQGFLLRLLLNGDGIAFYYPRREIVRGLLQPGVLGYLRSVLSDTLGVLRVMEYQDSIGGLIKGSEAGGPNAQYFLLADIFFTPIVGCLYSFAVGYVIATFRNNFFQTRTRSVGILAMQLFLALVAFDLAMDASLFVTEVFSGFAFCVPLYLFAKLCRVGSAEGLSMRDERLGRAGVV